LWSCYLGFEDNVDDALVGARVVGKIVHDLKFFISSDIMDEDPMR
jgi:hypothetical protein